MNQTKKRLSIIELAISITDIETIQLQMLRLDPLRSDTKIDEILMCLEDENYGYAQNLIQSYIVMPQETVIQRIQEEEISDEQAIFDEYDFLIDPTSKSIEDTEELPINSTHQDIDNSISSITEVENTIEKQEVDDEIQVENVPNDYTSLLDIQASDILSDNIQLNVSTDKEMNFPKKKIDFDLGTIPKDDFFDTPITSEYSVPHTEIEESYTPPFTDDFLSIPEKDVLSEVAEEEIRSKLQKEIITDHFFSTDTPLNHKEEHPVSDFSHVEEDISTIAPLTPSPLEKDTFYPAIPTIYGQFQDIQIQYPTMYISQGYSDELETWLEKIADEGYAEEEVEEILKYIEQLALTDKAQAAQFLLLTAKTESKYAKFILARALYRGSLLERNLDESFKIMSYLAFDEKYPEAICDLAQFYENGISITKDKSQAELLYQEAISLGIQRAIPHYTRIQNENKGLFSFLKR